MLLYLHVSRTNIWKQILLRSIVLIILKATFTLNVYDCDFIVFICQGVNCIADGRCTHCEGPFTLGANDLERQRQCLQLIFGVTHLVY